MRTNDVELGARLQAVLSAHVVPDVEAPPNLSLFVGADEGPGPRREFHRIYRDGITPVACYCLTMGGLDRAVEVVSSLADAAPGRRAS